jgi:tetratricopeptide (TPR) repeat protein
MKKISGMNVDSLIILGKIALKMKKIDDALNYFLQADALSAGKNSQIKNTLGLIYFKKKNYLKAINFYGDAIIYETTNKQYKLNLVSNLET